MEAMQMAAEAEQMNNMETYHGELVQMLAEPVENVHKAQNLIDRAGIVVREQQHNNKNQMEQEQYAVGRQNQLLHVVRLQGVFDHQQQWMQEEALHNQHLVAEQNEAQQQHVDNLDAALDEAQCRDKVINQFDDCQQQQRIQTMALGMRTASVHNYIPTKTHVHCVINKWHTVREALIIGGDHCTQCAHVREMIQMSASGLCTM